MPSKLLKDPRVVMRILIGILLAANLVVAIIAFHPFGGSADDLQRQRQQLTAQLTKLRNQLDASKKHSTKVLAARAEGDKFLSTYFMDTASDSAVIFDTLDAWFAALEFSLSTQSR